MWNDRYARRRLITFVVLIGLCVVMLIVSGSGPVQELRRGVKFAIAPVQDSLSVKNLYTEWVELPEYGWINEEIFYIDLPDGRCL